MMSKEKVLLVGDTSTPEALGNKFLRGANTAGLDAERNVLVAYTSPAPIHSPSMRSLRGKLFYRLADRRSKEWWGFQKQLKSLIAVEKPGLVLVTGILPLSKDIFKTTHDSGGIIANYLTDDPWNPNHRRRCFIRNIQEYDHIFSTKESIRDRLKEAGATSSSWLPFAYDPEIHYQNTSELSTGADVLFVGTGDRERMPWLDSIAEIKGLDLRVHGNNWKNFKTGAWKKYGALQGDAYCKEIGAAKITLGLTRERNGDLSTDRSYEIGAIGGCGIYRDTSEHREIFKTYPEVGFFENPDELKRQVLTLLDSEELRNHLRREGKTSAGQVENTYGARLKTILETLRSMKGKL